MFNKRHCNKLQLKNIQSTGQSKTLFTAQDNLDFEIFFEL